MPQNNRKYLNDSQTSLAARLHINWLTSSMYSLQDKITSVTSNGLSKSEAKQLYGPAAIRPHLLGGGAHALTLNGMLGTAAEPQLANIPITVGILSKIPTDFGTSEAGEIFVAQDVGHFFIWTGSAWTMLDGAGYVVVAPTSPVPTSFWVQLSGLLPTSVNVTKPDGTGTTSVSFPAYSAPGGYNSYARI